MALKTFISFFTSFSSSNVSTLKGMSTTTVSITCTSAGSAAARCWDHRAFAPALPRADSIARRENYSRVCRIFLQRHKPHNASEHLAPTHTKNRHLQV
ncbi:hypothetical protein I7I48_08176 [Histoplasma ohiense]|nr:hypothetical protein I7I48_08176 [Histoplasma ohiense (nom. inval.)]